jgi:hypothetical protein
VLLLEEVGAWLRAKGIGPVVYEELPDKGPDEVVVLADTGGMGLTLEGALDRPTVQVLVRAATSPRARELAFAVDRLILDAVRPTVMGGTVVVDAGRVGGRPASLGRDDRGRMVRSANYWFESER